MSIQDPKCYPRFKLGSKSSPAMKTLHVKVFIFAKYIGANLFIFDLKCGGGKVLCGTLLLKTKKLSIFVYNQFKIKNKFNNVLSINSKLKDYKQMFFKVFLT